MFGGATMHPKAPGKPSASMSSGVGEVAQLDFDPYVATTIRGTSFNPNLELGLDEASYIVLNVVVPALLPTSANKAPH